MNALLKTAAVALAVWFLSNRGRDAWETLTDGAGGGSGPTSGTGGAGGSGGAGGAGMGNSGEAADYATLAAAIQALAAGVRLPNIQSVTINGVSGNNEVVAGEGGKAIRVLAYMVTTSTTTVYFKSGAANQALWGIDLSTTAGRTGANLATAWPGYLFSTVSADALNVVLTGSAVVSVTYWKEDQ